MPRPSDVDVNAMGTVLHFQDQTPRHVVMLIIGHAATKPEWRFHLFRRKDFRNVTFEGVRQMKDRPKKFGLALSGGGSRAVAFHLGCMRALNDRGILDHPLRRL